MSGATLLGALPAARRRRAESARRGAVQRAPWVRVLWPWFALSWVALAAVDAGREMLITLIHPSNDPQLAQAATRSALSTGVWLLVSLAALAFAARRPLPGRRDILLAVLAAAVLSVTAQAVQSMLSCYPYPAASCTTSLRWKLMVIILPSGFHLTLNLFALGYALSYASRHAEREERAHRLSAELSRARLDALNVQLRPHFIFNALQSVATLMHRDPRAAGEMLDALRTLLRHSLDAADEQEIPLAAELEVVRRYVEIEQVRYGERLAVELRVDAEARDALVPQFILQPLVENAVRHVAARRGDARVLITAAPGPGGVLHIAVTDNGPGLGPHGAARAGVGLENVRARLDALYGGGAALELAGAPGEGLSVRLALPIRRHTGEGT